MNITKAIKLTSQLDEHLNDEISREKEEKERRTMIVNRLLGVYNNSTKAFEIKISKE